MTAVARKRMPVMGSKGGEAKAKKPNIAANGVPSLATVRMVYLWSWGPIVGPVNGPKSIKLDGTPLVSEDGTENFPGVKWQFRNGELNQERLEGLTESNNEISVNRELLSTAPYLHSISNTVVDAVRVRFGCHNCKARMPAATSTRCASITALRSPPTAALTPRS